MMKWVRWAAYVIAVLTLLAGSCAIYRQCSHRPVVKPGSGVVKVYPAPKGGKPWESKPPEVYQVPVVRIPLVTRPAPVRAPLPVPEGRVSRVIEISPPEGTSGPPVSIVETTDGEVVVPQDQAGRVRVIEFKPARVRWELSPMLGIGVERADWRRPAPVLSIGILSFAGKRGQPRACAGPYVSYRTTGGALSVRLWRRFYASGTVGYQWRKAEPGSSRLSFGGTVSVRF